MSRVMPEASHELTVIFMFTLINTNSSDFINFLGSSQTQRQCRVQWHLMHKRRSRRRVKKRVVKLRKTLRSYGPTSVMSKLKYKQFTYSFVILRLDTQYGLNYLNSESFSCGKILKNETEMEFHAAKTQHSNFSGKPNLWMSEFWYYS